MIRLRLHLRRFGLVVSLCTIVRGACVYGQTTIQFFPESQSCYKGDTVFVEVKIANVTGLHAVQTQVTFNSDLLTHIDVEEGAFLNTQGSTWFTVVHKTSGGGNDTLQVDQAILGAFDVDGGGRLYLIAFAAQDCGTAPLHLLKADIRDSQNQPIGCATADGAVSIETAGVQRGRQGVPSHFSLGQNYPNPFNGSTTIPLYLQQAGTVCLDILNSRGHLVKRLVNGNLLAGEHGLLWTGLDQSGETVPTGLYLARCIQGNGQVVQKLLISR